MNPLVTKLEEKLLPEFEKIADRINQMFPNVLARAESCEVGSLTQYQGYGFVIDCLLKDASDYETDSVALEVSVGYLTTNPRICAGVGWGHPSGKSEASFKDWGGIFPDEGIEVSNEVLEDLYKELPRLYEALFEALKRRKPNDE
ncbi:MAG: hypothetical protein ACR2HG_04205 [Pyrinomonadaceae bacterium]